MICTNFKFSFILITNSIPHSAKLTFPIPTFGAFLLPLPKQFPSPETNSFANKANNIASFASGFMEMDAVVDILILGKLVCIISLF